MSGFSSFQSMPMQVASLLSAPGTDMRVPHLVFSEFPEYIDPSRGVE